VEFSLPTSYFWQRPFDSQINHRTFYAHFHLKWHEMPMNVYWSNSNWQTFTVNPQIFASLVNVSNSNFKGVKISTLMHFPLKFHDKHGN
jgi:hypothetical protein